MDNRPDAEMTGMELNEAAEIMGTTPEALRKRIQRGSVRGYKVDGRWYVVLPDEYNRQDSGKTQQTDENEESPDDGRTRLGSGPDGVQTHDALIEAMKDEIQFLRRELEARTEENRRKDHIIAGLAQRIPELPEMTQTHERQENLKQEILDVVHQEIAATQEHLDAREAERERRIEERDQRLMETLRMLTEKAQEQPKKRSWWRR